MRDQPAPARIERRGLCFVVAAPSGTGKSSLTRALLAAEPELGLSVSVTTRAPRPGEVEGKHYYFRTPAEFEALRASGGLLEWAHVFGRETLYGTPRAPVEAALARGQDMIFTIDWQGFRQMRAALPDDVVGVFLLPPSLEALEERLRLRGQDSEAEIARRMASTQGEMEHYAEFDYAVVNQRFEDAVADLQSILRASRLATARQTGLCHFTRMVTA
ncbi:MAG: guanylate kinase [Proteobacteria bacterium]|nr:guanylate kinase [Pseudomonadota bacterium]